MSHQPHTHTKDCPDYKAAAADRAKRDAAAKERETRHQALAHAEWMGERRFERDERVGVPKLSGAPR